jgi:hypothetical protein
MMGRRRSVGRVSMSGFWPSENKPDNRFVSVINNLPPNCRVCRVFLGVETRRGTVVFARIWWLPAIPLSRLDLNDARQ